MGLNVIRCDCGAVTISDNLYSNSMFYSTFRNEYPDLILGQLTDLHCDHCVNHWGIDLCICGSGIVPDKCCNEPAQIVNQSKRIVGWQ